MESEPLRMWKAEDYPMLQGWWEGHGWPPVPQRMLPPLGVIFDNRAAGWLYMDNGGTGIAMLEWLVTDPESPALAAVKALRHVVDFLTAEAKRLDYGIVLTTARQDGLVWLLERAGFKVTDQGMTHLIGVF